MELIHRMAKRNRVMKTTDRLLKSGVAVFRVFEADTFMSRLKGLHAVLPLGTSEGLLIEPCNAIHTMTMRSSIDVLFLDKTGTVLRTETVRPFRFSYCRGACAVVETSVGSIQSLNIAVGDVLDKELGVWK